MSAAATATRRNGSGGSTAHSGPAAHSPAIQAPHTSPTSAGNLIRASRRMGARRRGQSFGGGGAVTPMERRTAIAAGGPGTPGSDRAARTRASSALPART
ncbi:hypothetical protein [Streptomyces sp. H34-S4]|uniref:hypothetical protein n=1 Tax=Streptomyces sp. H34-S4 TaxID=2996463 RepID=UPI00226FC7D4|nr:hypothetical protein [Streptomyces sp. H34-S4]MCY0937447.1 hypothetical protein [Streptomyces sp. H34-S4]